MADADHVRRLALALAGRRGDRERRLRLPGRGQGFVWSYPERVPGRRRVIRTDIAVLYVGDEAEKQALLLGEPELFFSTPAYDHLRWSCCGSTGSTPSGSRSSSSTPGGCAVARTDAVGPTSLLPGISAGDRVRGTPSGAADVVLDSTGGEVGEAAVTLLAPGGPVTPRRSTRYPAT